MIREFITQSVTTYKLYVKTSSSACIHTLSRALQLRTSHLGWEGLQHCHVSYGSRPLLPSEVSSDAATCPTALDLASRLRLAPTLLCVLWLRTSPPVWDGLRRCHIFYGSGPHLLAGKDSDAVTCPTAPCEPWDSSIKKNIACLLVQLDTHVSNTCAHVSKMHDVWPYKTCEQVALFVPTRHSNMQLQYDYSAARAL
jgi:hypothetical protein